MGVGIGVVIQVTAEICPPLAGVSWTVLIGLAG